MEISSSESSDSDSQSEKTLDFTYLMLDTNTLSKNFEHIAIHDKHSSRNTETLLLYNNQLKSLPINITIFNQLKVLDVSSNGLTHLPEELSECPLTTFIAKNNALDNESFPKSFSSLKGLKELNLSGNNLTVFPRQILEFSSLKYLYLGGNQIGDIPKEIWKVRGLQILYMGGNRLTEVPMSLGQLTNLHALVLCDNMLESLPSAIANLRNLKTLLLHKNKLKTLPLEIVGLQCLAELSLRDNPLVVQFVTNMQLNPSSLLEHAGRVVKLHNIPYSPEDLPLHLVQYLDSAHHCLNPKCEGVYFDNRVEHIKFVDFCGKYRIPLLHYLCSSKCVQGNLNEEASCSSANSSLLKKVLLG